MSGEQLADLDELILRCKGAAAKAYIAEAIACYKAGAYRACIVATWIAVVYDIIGKLRELDLVGDKNAHARLEQFEEVRSTNEVARSLEFERQILTMAKKEFELITPLEHIDLVRLQEDRNRCAHPSMNALDEIYLPSAELARTHLRNAIVYLLQHPPVQGKAALDRLVSEVDSVYFPVDVEDAIAHFSSGPLARPRESLVRNFVVALIKGLLLNDPDDYFPADNRSAALNAVRSMHREFAEKALYESLGGIMRRVSDSNLFLCVAFLSRVSDTWQYVPDDMHGKLERYVEEAIDSEAARSIDFALNIKELTPSAEKGLVHVGRDDLAALVKMTPRQAYADRAIEFYVLAPNFAQANALASDLVIPLISGLESRHVRTIVESIQNNSQIRFSAQLGTVLEGLYEAGKLSRARYEQLIADS